jgi:hypothetical protein
MVSIRRTSAEDLAATLFVLGFTEHLRPECANFMGTLCTSKRVLMINTSDRDKTSRTTSSTT